MKKYLLFAFLFAFTLSGFSEEGDSLMEQRSSFSLPLVQPAATVADNPAQRHLLSLPSLLRVALSHERRKTTSPVFYSPYEGQRKEEGQLSVDGWLRSSDKSSMATGFARYERGKTGGQRWTNVSDVSLFYPYLSADTLTGQLYTEAYTIGGTWSKGGRRWTGGIGAAFRGENHFRKKDPRLDNTSSAFTLQVGGSYALHGSEVGVSYATDWYSQRVGVSNLEDNRKDYFYSFVGFGLYDRKFTDVAASFQRYYDRRAHRLSLSYVPRTASGLTAKVGFGWGKSRVEEDEIRQPYRRSDHRWEATAYYTHLFSSKEKLQVGGAFLQEQGKGTEVQYDVYVVSQTPYVTSYQSIYEAEKLGIARTALHFFAYYQRPLSAALLAWARYEATYENHREDYALPAYFLHHTAWTHWANVGIRHQLHRHIYGVEVGTGWRRLPAQSSSLPSRKDAFPQAAEQLHAFRTTPWRGVRLALTCDMRLSRRHLLSLALSYLHRNPLEGQGRGHASFTAAFWW